MPPGVTWTVPEGGFFIWVTLPQEINTTRMHPQVRELGVEYLPGATCFADGSGANQLRLSFSFVEDDRIAQGVRTIADVIRGEVQEARG
jgi:DNA-binding transcriptional MocR family regulator